MIRQGEEILAAICGGSKCGKTTLARVGLVPWLWRRHRLRSIVFDPFCRRNQWGPTAWATDDLEAFRRAVWGTAGCAVFWDESSDSLDRHAREDRKFFTRIRHEHRALFVLLHDFTVLTPLMRGNLSDAFIFRQTEQRAEDWASLFTDRDLLAAGDLRQREFLHKSAFRPVRRSLPTVEDLGRMDFIP
jgi:hypothetical protein